MTMFALEPVGAQRIQDNKKSKGAALINKDMRDDGWELNIELPEFRGETVKYTLKNNKYGYKDVLYSLKSCKVQQLLQNLRIKIEMNQFRRLPYFR